MMAGNARVGRQDRVRSISEVMSLPRVASMALIIGVAPGGASGQSRPVSTQDVATILTSATHYVEQFEKAFAVVISDERCSQHVRIPDPPIAVGQPSRSSGISDRSLQSEMLFMWIPEDRRWLSVRNVLAVDGKSIDGSAEALDRALKAPLSKRESRLHQLSDFGARFNIGVVHRNFNIPTLALQFLDAGYVRRFRFSIDDRPDQKADTSSFSPVKIDFTEMQRPTVIRDGRTNLPATGSIWVRPSDGVVVRTVLNVTGTRSTPASSIQVEYRLDSKLQMWVPSRMEESYRVIRLAENAGSTLSGQTRFEQIESVDTYSNFRRFETFGRIVPQ